MDLEQGAMIHSPGNAIRVEALRYRSLQHLSRDLGPFHVLVGPNGSGKSTILDIISFLADIVRSSVESAVQGDVHLSIPFRAPDGKQLTWMRQSDRFELAIELAIPMERLKDVKNGNAKVCRYEVAIDVKGPLKISSETLWLKPADELTPQTQRSLFPQPPMPPETIVQGPRKHAPKGWKKIVSRGEEPERVVFCSETSGWNNPFRLNSDKTALASLPEDEERFPAATWFRQVLSVGVQRIVLSSEEMRRPSPPGRSRTFLPDGSNLPHEIGRAHV